MNTMTFEIKSAAHAKLAAEFLARFYALDEPEAVFHHQAAKEVKAEVATEAVIEKAKAKTKPVDKPPVDETAPSVADLQTLAAEKSKVVGIVKVKETISSFGAKTINDLATEKRVDLKAALEGLQ